MSWQSVTHICFLAFSHQYLHNFSFQSTDYFSHLLLQRWEAKIRHKEKSPQPGIKLTNIRSWVWHAHHWANRAGQYLFGWYLYLFINISFLAWPQPLLCVILDYTSIRLGICSALPCLALPKDTPSKQHGWEEVSRHIKETSIQVLKSQLF